MPDDYYVSQYSGEEIDDAIARALPGGDIDTLFAGKAPAGYGLGTGAVPIDDYNNAVHNGWYRGGTNYPSKINYANYGMIRVDSIGQIKFQTFYAGETGNAMISPFMAIRKSGDYGATWSEWEYVNPPMVIGVEYRTTERYLGKPVYALCANFGANIDGSSMYFGENVLNIVRGQAFTGQGINLYPWYNGNTINNWTAFFDFEVVTDTSDNIQKVKVTCRASSSASGSYSTNYVVLHYTKSTD